MSDRIKGQRDSHSDNWSWGPPGGGGPAQGSRRPPPLPWRPALLVAVALVLIATGVGLLVLADDNGGNSSVNGSIAPTSSPDRTRTEGATASSETTAGPTRTPAQPVVRLFAWSRQGNEWVDGTLPAGAGYKEGDAIPVLLQIDGATSGSFYETMIHYQCGTDRGAGFDFLASPAKVDSESVLIDPAPGRARPDSSVPIPNDPNITYDDGVDGRFQLWEGTFQQSLQGPLPPAPCDREKEFHLITLAASNTVSLGWAAHLASARDWGEGKGSASAGAPLTIEVTIGGVVDALLTVADGAIAP